MDNANDLELLLRSRHTLLVAPVSDEQRFVDVVRRAAAAAGLDLWIWSVTKGLARDGGDPVYGTQRIATALDFVTQTTRPGIFVFADVNAQLEDPLVVRRIKDTAAAIDGRSTVVLAGPGIAAPEELAAVAHTWRLRPPDPAELRTLVARTLRDLDARGFLVAVSPDDLDGIVAAVTGLSLHQAERLVQRMALDDGTVRPGDVGQLAAARAEILADDGVLELVEASAGTLDDVGGLETLKEWLHVRRKASSSPGGEHLDPPRGILLTGIPGTGKSFVAKTLAGTWGRPLVLLDPGTLYSKYLGESEQRLRTALDTVAAMAPAVLWIDEIEKGFGAGREGDGGASARILGTFLRWLQDRPAEVFVVATANDVAALPPELMRKGRFDEVFFVDVPGHEARAAIIRTHLARRGTTFDDEDIEALAAASNGFTGAELETAIVAAMYRAVAAGTPVGADAIAAELAATVPLTRSRAEEVAALRSWAAERAVPA